MLKEIFNVILMGIRISFVFLVFWLEGLDDWDYWALSVNILLISSFLVALAIQIISDSYKFFI